MRKTCQKLFVLILAVFLFTSTVYSAALKLTKVGSFDISDKNWTEIWYTGTNFSLSGTAGANADVTVTINDAENSVAADSSGNWSISTNMGEGDHEVVLSSGGETVSYKIHAGQNVPTDTDSTQTTSDTPISDVTTKETTTGAQIATGSSQLVGLVISATLVSYGIYLYLQGKKEEKSYLK